VVIFLLVGDVQKLDSLIDSLVYPRLIPNFVRKISGLSIKTVLFRLWMLHFL